MCFLEMPIDKQAWTGRNLDTLGVRFNEPNDTLLQGDFVVWGGTHRSYGESVRPDTGPPADTKQSEVQLFRGDAKFRGCITVQLLENRDVRVALDGPTGTIEVVDRDAFEAFRQIRRTLDPSGWRVAVAGARRDASSSGMQRDMLNGLAVYLHVEPPGAKLPSAATFDPAPPETVGTVEEQDAFLERWGRG